MVLWSEDFAVAGEHGFEEADTMLQSCIEDGDFCGIAIDEVAVEPDFHF